ncbi:hypothetical protein LCGC14_3105600, partial [marine sediment metagenome]
ARRVANGEAVKRTDYIDKMQTFSMDEINTATASMLTQAIDDRIKDGYILKWKRLGQQDQGPNLTDSVRILQQKRLADNHLSSSDPQTSIYSYHYGKLLKDIQEWWKDRSSVDLTAFGLRLILQNMIHTGDSEPKTPPDKFKASIKTLYSANGWDSSPDNPAQNMLTLPPLRQLPRGEVIYDRGNGNMGYDHLVLNWHIGAMHQSGLAQIFEKWGAKCDEWLRTLQGSQRAQEMQQSPEVAAAWQNVISLQSGNRTGAETLLELLKDYPNWNEFNRNHLQKSLASEIRTVNKLRKNPVSLQSFQGNLPQQIRTYVQQILQGHSDPGAAYEQLIQFSSELVQHYMN